MGLYVNPGNENFKKCIKDEIFIDKSMLLGFLNKKLGTSSSCLCVSRPRRFGKTMAESMMAAYYSCGCDSSELFKNLKIAKDPSYSQHLNKYNVLHVDLNGFWSNSGADCLVKMAEAVIGEFESEFSDVDFSKCVTIPDCLQLVFLKTHIPFVVIVDEYDVLVRDNAPKRLFEDYLRLLNAMFKSSSASSCIALAYLTGILPIVRDKFQSKLNNFDEYTILSSAGMAGLIGFTENEAEQVCKDHNLDYQECRRWYNGYVLNGINLYTPKSVVTAAKRGEFDSYWTQTSYYEAISDCIKLDFEGIREDIQRMIAGEEIAVDIQTYNNTFGEDAFKSKDDVFVCLIHLGYLAYNKPEGTCRIPNFEVRREWVRAIKASSNLRLLFNLINESKSLLEATWNNDAQAVASLLSKTHQSLTSPLSYNNEKSFQSAIRLAYFYADSYYTVISELPTGKGFADIAFVPFVPDKPAMIVELKVDGSSDTAIDQIRRKNYPQVLEKYKDNLLLVAITYDRKTKEHECRIEKP